MLSLFIAFLVGMLLNFDGNQSEIFFAKTGNYMADFFNVAKYSADKDPYYNTINGLAEKSYLPISYVVMYGMSRLADYKHSEAFVSGMSSIGLVTSTFFMFFTSAILYVQLYELKNGTKVIKFLISNLMILSGIFIFSFERGNLIILTAILIIFFIVNYQSDNIIIRELAYISLALAAAFKGYPALLGILLIYEKRNKDAIKLVLYGILVAFVPFLFLKGGFTNIPQWLSNLKESNNNYEYAIFPRFSYRLILNMMESQFGILERGLRDQLGFALSLLTKILAVISLISTAFQNCTWKKVGTLVCIILLVPTNSAFYTGIYLFPVIIMYLNENHNSIYEYLYLLLFLGLLNPFQIVIYGINLTTIISNLSVSTLFILLFIDNIIIFSTYLKGKIKIKYN